MNDLKFAVRQLLKYPGFTAVAVLTLALGIGANTTIFSVLYAVMLRPLPIPKADRVVQIWESWRGGGDNPVAWPKFIDWRAQAQSFEAMAGCDWGDELTLTGKDRPEKVAGRAVSPGFFEVLKELPILGRSFVPADAKSGAARVAIIGHDLWRRKFNQDPKAIGRTVQLDLKDYTVVGVLLVRTKTKPASLIPAVRKVVWSLDKDQPLEDFKTMRGVASDWIAPQRFNAGLLAAFAGLALLLAAVGIYGVLAYSVNQRRREIGLRMALGAQRKDVLGLILRQGGTLVGVGVVIGLAGAIALTRVIGSLLYGVGPTDPATFIIITCLLGAIALFACWLPARRAANIDPMSALRHE